MSHSSSLWMTPRNGDVNCEACTDRSPCMNHDLTFGANFDNYSRAINVSRIALTEIISLTNTETPTPKTMVTTQITATEVPTDQVLELIAKEESRLQDKVGDCST